MAVSNVACLPTGSGNSGKSLCCCLLPYESSRFSQRGEQKSVVLVVSPLISLIKDQVRAIEEKNMTMVYSGDEDEHSENLPFQGRTSCS